MIRNGRVLRNYTTADDDQHPRCTANVILRDKSGAQCMRPAVADGLCWQHRLVSAWRQRANSYGVKCPTCGEWDTACRCEATA